MEARALARFSVKSWLSPCFHPAVCSGPPDVLRGPGQSSVSSTPTWVQRRTCLLQSILGSGSREARGPRPEANRKKNNKKRRRKRRESGCFHRIASTNQRPLIKYGHFVEHIARRVWGGIELRNTREMIKMMSKLPYHRYQQQQGDPCHDREQVRVRALDSFGIKCRTGEGVSAISSHDET